MRVYLAGRFSSQDELRLKADELDKEGIKVTSTWLNETVDKNINIGDVTQDYLVTHGKADIEDIRSCHVCVLFTVEPTQPMVRGGRHFESGFALGIGKKLITCGPKENIFHYLPNVVNYPTWDETKVELLRLKQLEDIGRNIGRRA